MRHRIFVLIIAVAAVTLGLAGCAVPAQQSGADGAVPSQLQFTATTLDGDEFAGAGLLGNPAVFWFWTPWCPTCQREAPMVAAAASEHPAVSFVGVASASQPPAMREFVEKYALDAMTQLDDGSGQVWAKFGVTKQPAFAFLTADGHIDVAKGPMSMDALDQRLGTLSRS